MEHLANFRFDRLKVRSTIGWYILISIGVTILLMAIGIEVKHRSFLSLSYILSFVGTCVWIFHRCDRADIDIQQIIGKPNPSIRWGKVAGLTLAALTFSLATFLVLFGSISYLFPQQVETFLNSIRASKQIVGTANDPIVERILSFLTIVVFAPLCEELIFRGIILNRWAQKWNLRIALIASALFFGILHFSNPIGLSMLGLILGLLYVQTKTLWTPIFAHALNNGLVYLVTLSPRSAASSKGLSIASLQQGLWVGVVLLVISSFFMGRFIYRNFPPKVIN